MGWGIWIGGGYIWVCDKEETTVIGERAGRGVAGGLLDVGSDQ
jgi:hypothetical protein